MYFCVTITDFWLRQKIIALPFFSLPLFERNIIANFFVKFLISEDPVFEFTFSLNDEQTFL